MKLLLNNIFKGLLVSLLVISLGGFLYINISKPEEINLQLISSSVVNQLGTESKNIKENKNDKLNNENKTLVEEKKETEVNEEKKEDTTEEVADASKETEVTETPKEETKTEEKTEVQEEVKEETKEEVKEETPKVEENTQENVEKEPEKVEDTNPVLEAPKEEAPQNNQNSNTDSNTITPKGTYAPNMEAVNAATVKNTYVGLMTAYGPDCVGCGGMVAHGEYVGGGNIYYNDKTFGNIRIVAGDRSLGFGTIIRIKGVSAEPIIAIMLDTGGAIGFNKGTYFDLLYVSEAAASSFGRPKATFEILRYGF